MILHIFNIAFLILSGCGATIIISKGDIFKSFRDWVDRMSHKNKKFIHDITIPEGEVISIITIDDKTYPENLLSNEYNEIEQAIRLLPISDFIKVRVERVKNFATRIYIETLDKHSMAMTLSSKSNTFGVYENTERIPWVQFIATLINCPQCAGVWVGMIWYVIYKIGGLNFPPFIMLCTGCVVSLFSYLYFKTYLVLGELNSYLEKLGNKK